MNIKFFKQWCGGYYLGLLLIFLNSHFSRLILLSGQMEVACLVCHPPPPTPRPCHAHAHNQQGLKTADVWLKRCACVLVCVYECAYVCVRQWVEAPQTINSRKAIEGIKCHHECCQPHSLLWADGRMFFHLDLHVCDCGGDMCAHMREFLIVVVLQGFRNIAWSTFMSVFVCLVVTIWTVTQSKRSCGCGVVGGVQVILAPGVREPNWTRGQNRALREELQRVQIETSPFTWQPAFCLSVCSFAQ